MSTTHDEGIPSIETQDLNRQMSKRCAHTYPQLDDSGNCLYCQLEQSQKDLKQLAEFCLYEPPISLGLHKYKILVDEAIALARKVVER